MLGIIQEQHADRCRLFMQWKRMDWPVLIDPLNLLGVAAVPITLAIDENGIVRRQLRHPDQLAAFLEEDPLQSHPSPSDQPAAKPDLDRLRAETGSGDPDAWRAYADALVLWGGSQGVNQAIAAYGRALSSQPDDGPTHFRLGVVHRLRYDSPLRTSSDFRMAVAQWQAALDADPNNYIWRRRIQQYGPRLDKPYSFYDWVRPARAEIEARGHEPVTLAVEPGGAEFAQPARSFTEAPMPAEQPDPQGRITPDPGTLIEVETVVVPPAVRPGQTVRVHLALRPSPQTKAHWNNETGGLTVWLDLPDGWLADRSRLSAHNAPEPLSRETRRIEVELRCPPSAAPGPVTIPAYALYYVCQDRTGKCLYRRQDIAVHVTVRASNATSPSAP